LFQAKITNFTSIFNSRNSLAFKPSFSGFHFSTASDKPQRRLPSISSRVEFAGLSGPALATYIKDHFSSSRDRLLLPENVLFELEKYTGGLLLQQNPENISKLFGVAWGTALSSMLQSFDTVSISFREFPDAKPIEDTLPLTSDDTVVVLKKKISNLLRERHNISVSPEYQKSMTPSCQLNLFLNSRRNSSLLWLLRQECPPFSRSLPSRR